MFQCRSILNRSGERERVDQHPLAQARSHLHRLVSEPLRVIAMFTLLSTATLAAAGLLEQNDVQPFLMVDCSHANSGKDPARQPLVAADLAAKLAAGERALVATMVESNLVGGTQDYRTRPLVPGRSITDACLSWEQTLPVLAALAEGVRARRKT